MYELARHQNIQEKARKEVVEVTAKHGGKITYDALMEMEYLNQVFSGKLLH
jgi:cytochrome P450 family 6